MGLNFYLIQSSKVRPNNLYFQIAPLMNFLCMSNFGFNNPQGTLPSDSVYVCNYGHFHVAERRRSLFKWIVNRRICK